jgi:hypothetical protein
LVHYFKQQQHQQRRERRERDKAIVTTNTDSMRSNSTATGMRKRVSVSPGAGKSNGKQGKGKKMGQGTTESAAVRFGNAENHPNTQEGGANDDRKLPAKNLKTMQKKTTPLRVVEGVDGAMTTVAAVTIIKPASSLVAAMMMKGNKDEEEENMELQDEQKVKVDPAATGAKPKEDKMEESEKN